MEYRVLIRLVVPEIEESFEATIPVNKTVGEVSGFLNQMVNTLSEEYPLGQNIFLYNRRTGTPYSRDVLIRDTDIRNGTELVMIS